jgi:hypothetical protein
MTVTLYNAAGDGDQHHGYGRRRGLEHRLLRIPQPAGGRATGWQISFPGGFVPQTATSAWRNLTGFGAPEYLDFGYTRTENRSLTGYTPFTT